jgi:hypothetical protein
MSQVLSVLGASLARHRHREARVRVRVQRTAGVVGHQVQGLIHSPCAAGVALVLLAPGQAATGDAAPVHKPACEARGILGRSPEEAVRHVAVVDGCSNVAVVGVGWIDGDARRRGVVTAGGSRFRHLADRPAAVAGAVVVVDSPRSWDSDFP